MSGAINTTLDSYVAALVGTESVDFDLNIVDPSESSGFSYLKVYGDIKTRYWGGHSSDSNLPVDFHYSPNSETITSTGQGSVSRADRSLNFTFLCDDQVPSSFVAYSFSTGDSSFGSDMPVGSRVVTNLTINRLDENAGLVVGLASDHSYDAWGLSSRLGIEIENLGGHLVFTLLWKNESRSTYIPFTLPAEIENQHLALEIERLSDEEARARVYKYFEDLDTPIVEILVSASSGPVQSDLFLLTPSNTNSLGVISGYLTYVDVEVGDGDPFPQPQEILESTSKYRKLNQGPLYSLSNGDGAKQVCLAFVDEDFSDRQDSCSSVSLNTEVPTLEILDVVPESSIKHNGIIKTSPNPGFDRITVTFHASISGNYEIRSNSDNYKTGNTLASGQYFHGNVEEVDFAASSSEEGISDITVYLISTTGISTAKFPLDLNDLPRSPSF